MDDWERCVEKTKEWVEFLKPYVEDELGPLPSLRYLRPFFRGESQRLTNVPFRNAYREGQEAWVVYDKVYEIWFYRHFRSEDIESNEFGLGRFVYALTHDLVHPYQFQPLMAKKGVVQNYIYRCVRHFQWLEGLAQLYSFKICSRMYAEAQHEDFSQLEKGSIEDFLTHSLEEKKYKRSLGREITRNLFRDTKLLRGRGLINDGEFSFSPYQFELHPDLKEMVMKSDLEEENVFHRRWLRIRHYVLGAHFLSKIISEGTLSMEELVEFPLTDREIQNALI